MRVRPGLPSPLGARWDGSGVNFALAAPHATGVDLCLFDDPAARAERARVPLTTRTDNVWHGYLPDIGPGQLYGYRVAGPWNPMLGHRFNPAKVVLDPYARAIGRPVEWDLALFAYERGTDGDGPADLSDSAPFAPLGVVTADDAFDWSGDRRPAIAWSDTVLYELHVKGFTALHEAVPEVERGTFLGLASPPALDHLRSLGVTTVELMPVHAHADERRLAESRRQNYWGYNTLAFFVPDGRFVVSSRPEDAAREFKTMVKALHAAGLEVILDVVYNHTAEGDHLGPTLSLRGIDNATYYRLDPARPSHYENFTGCGNTLDTRALPALRLVMDSLRYWVREMHVDGFRFDLAPALAREDPAFSERAAFLHAVAQDPLLSRVKLVAEPWDLGFGGYQLGRFPPGWAEWNDRFRDDIRRFWRGDRGTLPALATRLAGSADLFGAAKRGPCASVNFITAHDGFTLADLVAYNEKHNDANGEANHDGRTDNYSWNCGTEGPSTDPAILDLRRRQRRNLMLTLLVSLGVPMIAGGDEVGRSQHGNNNAYCHDSPLTWTPWALDAHDEAFSAFVASLLRFRSSQPALRRRAFLNGFADGRTDVHWLRTDGTVMTLDDWSRPDLWTLGMLLDGTVIPDRDADGQAVRGDSVLALFNAGIEPAAFRLPAHDGQRPWSLVVDTARPDAADERLMPGTSLDLASHAAALLALDHGTDAPPRSRARPPVRGSSAAGRRRR